MRLFKEGENTLSGLVRGFQEGAARATAEAQIIEQIIAQVDDVGESEILEAISDRDGGSLPQAMASYRAALLAQIRILDTLMQAMKDRGECILGDHIPRPRWSLENLPAELAEAKVRVRMAAGFLEVLSLRVDRFDRTRLVRAMSPVHGQGLGDVLLEMNDALLVMSKVCMSLHAAIWNELCPPPPE